MTSMNNHLFSGVCVCGGEQVISANMFVNTDVSSCFKFSCEKYLGKNELPI